LGCHLDFDGDDKADQIQFAIKKMKIWTNPGALLYPFSGTF